MDICRFTVVKVNIRKDLGKKTAEAFVGEVWNRDLFLRTSSKNFSNVSPLEPSESVRCMHRGQV